MRGLLRRLDAWQRTRSWVGFPFAVVKKFGEDQAGNLAALVAYYAFFSVFPLLLAFATILGFVLHGHPDWQQTIEHSAFSQLPLVSDKNQPAPLTGNVAALVVGISLALWSGLGVAKSAQTAFNTVYLVAHTDRPNFLKSTLRALGLVAFGGIGLIVTTGLSSAIQRAQHRRGGGRHRTARDRHRDRGRSQHRPLPGALPLADRATGAVARCAARSAPVGGRPADPATGCDRDHHAQAAGCADDVRELRRGRRHAVVVLPAGAGGAVVGGGQRGAAVRPVAASTH